MACFIFRRVYVFKTKFINDINVSLCLYLIDLVTEDNLLNILMLFRLIRLDEEDLSGSACKVMLMLIYNYYLES